MSARRLISIAVLALACLSCRPAALASSPTASPAAQTYIIELTDKLGQIDEALETVLLLIQDIAETADGCWFEDAAWTSSMIAQADKIQQTHAALQDMDVPDEMQGIHAAVLRATADYDAAMNYLSTGIKQTRAEDINRATELIVAASEKLEDADALITAHYGSSD